MRSGIWGFAAIAALAAALLAFGAPAKKTPFKTLEKVNLALSWKHEARFAGEYAADRWGPYGDNGLEVDFIPYGGEDLVEGLLSGKHQFAIIQGDELLEARNEGKPIVGIYVTFRRSPTVFFSKKESGIAVPGDLVGKKVGVTDGERARLLAMLNFKGIDSAEVRIADGERDFKALKEGQLDAQAGWITDAETLVSEGVEATVMAADGNGADFYADVIVATEAAIVERPDLVGRFVRATADGWKIALMKHDAAAQLARSYDGSLGEVHLTTSLASLIPYLRTVPTEPLGSSSFAEWMRMYASLRDQGLLRNRIDVSAAYTGRFIP